MTLPVTFEVEADTRNVEIDVVSNTVDVAPGFPTVVFGVSPGPRGPVGPAGDGTQVFGEVLTGMDGVETVFATTAAFAESSTAVYINGLRETHYTESGAAEITFSEAPIAGDSVTLDYLIG